MHVVWDIVFFNIVFNDQNSAQYWVINLYVHSPYLPITVWRFCDHNSIKIEGGSFVDATNSIASNQLLPPQTRMATTLQMSEEYFSKYVNVENFHWSILSVPVCDASAAAHQEHI